jgi:tripeptidyl-peptidase I
LPSDEQPQAGYSPQNRGYPDVAFDGQYFPVIINGYIVGLDGTSASSPTFAGMISLINSARIRDGK